MPGRWLAGVLMVTGGLLGPAAPATAQAPAQPKPKTVRYEDGAKVAPGTHIEWRRDRKTLMASVSTLLGWYLGSVVAGAIVMAQGDRYDVHTGALLMVPVGGPFAVIPRVESSDEKGWLIVDGVLQSFGVIGIAIGLIGNRYLVYDASGPAGRSLSIAPMVGLEGGGLRLRF